MYPGVYGNRFPDRAAVVMAGSGETQTFAELDQRSSQLAHLLRAAGMRRGDHMAVFMENQICFMEVVWAALRSGLYLTAINSHLTAPEAAYIVEDCGAKAFLTSAALLDVAASMDPLALREVSTRLAVGASMAGFDSYEDALAMWPAHPIDDESSGSVMLYSSGTTGRPKGVVRRLPDEMPWEGDLYLASRVPLFGFRDSMVYLSPAPMYHAAPLGFSTSAQRFGGTVVMMEAFDETNALASIESHRVTHSQWVPTMFIRLLRLPAENRTAHDLSSHEVAVHAAAPCPPTVKQQMIDWWGPILYEYYAGTEGNGSTYITSEQWLEHPGSVGRALAGKVHILDQEGRELPPRTEGTIYFSGGAEFEYHHDPEKTAASRHPGGLSTLGDIGYLDEDGWLYLTDRQAFVIISGGVNIYPQEIENVLIQHHAVADVAVFGVPNDDLGEEVKAVVQPRPGVTTGAELAAELSAFSRGRLAAFKCPRSIDFEVQLPRSPTGKLYKRLLRDRYLGTADSTIV